MGTPGVVRWTGFALSPPLELLFLLQLLHGIAYAVGFLACTNLIADLAAENVAAEAQSVFNVLQSGVSFLALVAFGALAASLGAHAFLGVRCWQQLACSLSFCRLHAEGTPAPRNN